VKLPGLPSRKIFQMQEEIFVNMGGFSLVPSVYHQFLGIKSNLFCSHFEFQMAQVSDLTQCS
jgi:hypothetical protein